VQNFGGSVEKGILLAVAQPWYDSTFATWTVNLYAWWIQVGMNTQPSAFQRIPDFLQVDPGCI